MSDIDGAVKFNISCDWNPKQARLKEIIKKSEFFDEAVLLSLELHSIVHEKSVSNQEDNTFFDEILSNVNDDCFNKVTFDKDRTFVYNIWHITRIEDICANILIAGGSQVINEENWLKKINSPITETGNSLSAEEIADFSRSINREELLKYRTAVGKRTRDIIKQLKPDELKRKMNPAGLRRIIDENAVSQKPSAIWLIDFWGKKDVAGLIQMPLTRHQIIHLNDCLKIKNKSKR